MYSKETVKHAVEKLQDRIAFYRDAWNNDENITTVVSEGNKKIGDTLNVSLAPVLTCKNCSGCMKYCYDIKAVMAYRNVLNARAKNTALFLECPEKYFDDIERAIEKRKANKSFRWHVSGDIPTVDYFDNMVRIARKYPEWKFWTYTKAYDIVNTWCALHGKGSIPGNLSVMFSEWKGMTMVNPYGFPEFRVVMKNDEKPVGVRWCPGNCNKCIRNNIHCVKGETVYCMEH